MDALTHGLASFAIARAVFPKATRITVVTAIFAGAVADVDQLTAYAGPGAYLAWHRTATHSLAGTLVIVAVALIATILARRHNPMSDALSTVSLAVFLTCALHLGMDLTQNESVQLLWPFRTRRYSADWLAHFDLWILLMLLAGALLPQLLALVTEEIGAKSKGPRGRVGAIIALIAVFVYAGARTVLHSNAVAMMEARTYRGESPRHVAAFAESDSPFHWHGLVETERAFHDLDINVGPGSSFSPDAAVVAYKPESSAALDAARRTESVQRFLETARFPKATVEKTSDGYQVELRDLSQSEEMRAGRAVIAAAQIDANGKILNDELAWGKSR